MAQYFSLPSHSPRTEHTLLPPGNVAAVVHRPVNQPKRELKAIYCGVRRKRRIVLHYKRGRWSQFESLYPWDIREALQICSEQIEEAVPGSMEKAAMLDDENWLANKRRTRRYIAESPELLYIESPHLQSQSAAIAGYHVLTNIPWRDVPSILRLVCQAANIKFGSLADISF